MISTIQEGISKEFDHWILRSLIPSIPRINQRERERNKIFHSRLVFLHQGR